MLNVAFWSAVPLLVAFASFATAAYAGNVPLTADLISPSIALFMLLSLPLGMFAIVFGSIIATMVSVKRLGSFLQSPELQPDACTIMAPPSQPASGVASPLPIAKLSIEQGDVVVTIRDGKFRWSKDAIEPTLENINIEVKSGELLVYWAALVVRR